MYSLLFVLPQVLTLRINASIDACIRESAAVVVLSIILGSNLSSFVSLTSADLDRCPIFRIIVFVILLGCPDKEALGSREKKRLMYVMVRESE